MPSEFAVEAKPEQKLKRSTTSTTDGPNEKAWPRLRPYVLLSLLTLACLLPFSGRAFHIDDPLFIWTAREITKHPLHPYGFRVVWTSSSLPMFALASNPPLSSYYIALAGSLAGWSERALHVAFLAPALIVVLGTYRLAQRFTRFPFLAAVISLFTPVFLVSACSVMCDITMLALWTVGTILWIEGLERPKPTYLIGSALTLVACALTKYFGACSIILLMVYSVLKNKSSKRVAWYFLISAAILVAYSIWLHRVTDRSLLLSIASFAIRSQASSKLSVPTKAVVGLIFAGGCLLPALTYIPVLFSRLQILLGAILCAVLGLSVAKGWLDLGYAGQGHLTLVSVEAAIYFAGGLSVIALATRDVCQHSGGKGWRNWKRLDPDSLFLLFWIAGTLLFASFINWTNNGRSNLPAVPAMGLLLARQLEHRFANSRRLLVVAATIPLIVSGVFACWVASADSAIADSQRRVAELIHKQTQGNSGTIWFEGHWGFQYYMQSFGAQPLQVGKTVYRTGDYLVIPSNNTALFHIPSNVLGRRVVISASPSSSLTTQNQQMGASFYASKLGPLPFAFGPVPLDHYLIAEIIHSFRVSS